MRKITIGLLSLILLFSMSGCGNNKVKEKKNEQAPVEDKEEENVFANKLYYLNEPGESHHNTYAYFREKDVLMVNGEKEKSDIMNYKVEDGSIVLEKNGEYAKWEIKESKTESVDYSFVDSKGSVMELMYFNDNCEPAQKDLKKVVKEQIFNGLLLTPDSGVNDISLKDNDNGFFEMKLTKTNDYRKSLTTEVSIEDNILTLRNDKGEERKYKMEAFDRNDWIMTNIEDNKEFFILLADWIQRPSC